MAQNTTNDYRQFKYYEGVCSSSDFIKELAQVVSLGVTSETYKDESGNVIQEGMPIKVKNWDIVYPLVNEDWEGYTTHKDELLTRDSYLANIDNLTTEERTSKIKNQVSQITNTVVLRTKTTAVDISSSEKDNLSVSGESDLASTTMYVQFYKPTYLANPEELPLDAELQGITPQLVTKSMYQKARQSTASATYDLSQIANITDTSLPSYGIVNSAYQKEYVDCVSNQYDINELFDETNGVFVDLAPIFGYTNIEDVIDRPDATNRTTQCTISKSYLNSIKQTKVNLYNFLFGICGLKKSFTSTDYDLIDNMILKVTYSGTGDNAVCYVTLSYEKTVEVFTISKGSSINIQNIYSHTALDAISPELYSEGRYVPIPSEYISNSSTTSFTLTKDLSFSLDKTTDDNILYGTLVIRFDYDKKLDYTDISSLNITDSVSLPNNHYCLVRMFDNPASDFSGPEPNIEDAEGNITTTNSHSSPWSKLSWYKDFEEIMMDDIDEDVSTTSVSDGTLLVPLETSGLTSDTRISYWINTNNDRFTLIVMGNPALDYETDRHVISSCYIGRIDSFENSINDVSGNFALYTSSSTAPCNTQMTANDTQHHIDRVYQNEDFYVGASGISSRNSSSEYSTCINRDTNIECYKNHCINIGGEQEFSKTTKNGFSNFYITLTGNKFFNEDEMPKYMILDSTGNPVPLGYDSSNNIIYYDTVAYRDFIYGTSDSRSNQVCLYINNIAANNYTVYFNFGYYEEKFLITSGVSRDVFGNVVSISTIDDYGKNTSDGTTSVSMYHTRSKAFYQKHHFLFATTEEYMSKVMYGKSSYTGEYYADRIKITHGNDGPRGILSDTLVIDSSSLYPKDELVINKDWEKNPDELEETFTYFPITAPYSPLSDGPNARYGVAIKKSEAEPNYTDTSKIIAIAKKEVITLMENNRMVSGDTVLPSVTQNGCNVYWSVDSNSNWIEDSSSADSTLITLEYPDGSEEQYVGIKYNANNIDVTYAGSPTQLSTNSYAELVSLKLNPGSKPTKDFESFLKISSVSGYTIPTGTKDILYGYSDSQLTTLKKDTVITYIVDDGTTADDHMHEYPYSNLYVNASHSINDSFYQNDAYIQITSTGIEQNIYNANPSQYLNIFFVGEERKLISFTSLALAPTDSNGKIYERDDDTNFTSDNSLYGLLQYPCNVLVNVSGITNSSTQGIIYNSTFYSSYTFTYLPYNESYEIITSGKAGASAMLTTSHYDAKTETLVVDANTNTLTIPENDVIDDLYITIN